MTFKPLALKDQLLALEGVSRLVVAFSGGLDSCVLLHAIVALREQLELDGQIFPFSVEALHVNHGLSPNAQSWERFCERKAAQLAVPIQIVKVSVDKDAGASLENLARIKRYEAFELSLGNEDCLLMAHHLDDQAETFLLRSLRGSGPRGLAAIPMRRYLGDIQILRPLLDCSRATLSEYAQKSQLEWIEDESNDCLDFDRNYCRHVVLPTIEKRWPGFAGNWGRSAALCAEADQLMDEVAAQDLLACATDGANSLDWVAMMALSQARQRNLIRFWALQMNLAQPSWNTLQQIVESLLLAKEDAQGQVSWAQEDGRVELRRYHGKLILQQTLAPIEADDVQPWRLSEELALPANGTLRALPTTGFGLKSSGSAVLQVRYRQGGEKLRLTGRPNRPLKKILQDAEVAPWWRERVPLLYVDNELVCVPGVGIAQGWRAEAGEAAYEITWTPPSSDPADKKSS